MCHLTNEGSQFLEETGTSVLQVSVVSKTVNTDFTNAIHDFTWL